MPTTANDPATIARAATVTERSPSYGRRLEAHFVCACGTALAIVQVDEEVAVELHPTSGWQFTRRSQERSSG